MRPVFFLVLLFALSLPAPAVVAAPAPAADLTLVGSDLMGPKFAAAVAGFAQRANLPLKLALTGSRPGLEALQAGRADLALLVFSPEEKPPAAPFVAHPVAYHVAIVVVPASLPLAQVSFAQLRDIFSNSVGDAQNDRWSDLGVTAADWRTGKILPVIGGSGDGLASALFRFNVLSSAGLRPTVTVAADEPTALSRVSVKEGGLAIVSALPADQKQLRVVPMARSARDVAFLPTPENVHSGDYPVRLAVQVVFRADATARVLPLLRFLYSTEAAALWQDARLVPLPPQARSQQVLDLEAR